MRKCITALILMFLVSLISVSVIAAEAPVTLDPGMSQALRLVALQSITNTVVAHGWCATSRAELAIAPANYLINAGSAGDLTALRALMDNVTAVTQRTRDVRDISPVQTSAHINQNVNRKRRLPSASLPGYA